MPMPKIDPAHLRKPLCYDPARKKFIFFDEIVSGEERIIPVDILSEADLKRLVIERQRTGLDYKVQAISGPPFSRDDVVRAIEQDEPFGRMTLEAEKSYLRDLLNEMEGSMTRSKLLETIGHREADANEIAKEVIEKPKLVSEILEGLSSDTGRIRLGCAKVLRLISRKQPVLLYPQIDFFIQLLDSDNNVLKWNAIDIVANLTLVDSENIFNRHFAKYYSFISDESMITAAHVVDNSGKIALAKPELTEKITDELLGVEEHTYQTTECRNILLGKVILAIDQYFDQIEDKDNVIPPIRRQLKNPRNATRVRAEKFLGKYGF